MANPLPDDWNQWLGNEFQADYMLGLKAFLAEQKAAKKNYLSPLLTLVSRL